MFFFVALKVYVEVCSRWEILQVRIMHPNAKRIHIGADEAYTVGKDIRCMKRCERNLNFCTDRLKLSHISR